MVVYILNTDFIFRSQGTQTTDGPPVIPKRATFHQRQIDYQLVPLKGGKKDHLTSGTSFRETLTPPDSSPRKLWRELLDLVNQESECKWKEKKLDLTSSSSSDMEDSEESQISLLSFGGGGETPPPNPPPA
uniref:ORF3 n=1 Tax=Torque teno Arctocephalus gazella virus 1 TaxID=2249932 RepID=A0A2Z4N3A6_9VIRU|nr:ORF3 [Torque teno Arctocephalus gazella virus 1]